MVGRDVLQVLTTGKNSIMFAHLRYTTEQLCSLKGHSGFVRSISWRDNDMGMASCGIDGAVYEWTWVGDGSPTMERVGTSDHVYKASQYESVVCGPRGKSGTTMLAAGRDGVVRELECGNVHAQVQAQIGRVTQLCVSRSDKLLLVGAESGSLRAYEQPLGTGPEPVDEACTHSGCVTRVVLSADEAVCFSASESGHIFMYEMLGEGAAQRERAARRKEEEGTEQTDTVLVSKGEVMLGTTSQPFRPPCLSAPRHTLVHLL